ncbi:gamma-glutamyltransferase [Thiohalobacter sp. IOR34]|uniref:gamma-glutamyltransferase family protein n=1 Tax=Thiohalobacter sp. IOR34 TaxID=3057176 RepID=UPI0025B1B58C|nr:gamma-glutamyltransferase [Thiohalobacter sp. IOR34]WJW76399.1 gamma-glutamyltransferase [Thiohalobacter sp. IOR34]
MSRRREPHDADAEDLGRHPLPIPQRLAASRQGMVASAHYLATEAGVEALAEGGNAVDAAVTTALALSVCEPAASGLGGQSMLLIHDAASGRSFALDGSSRAPHRVPPGAVPKEQLFRGHRASTVPSTPAVLAYALHRYGTFSWARALEPAIRLAEEGYRITQLQHDLTRRERPHLQAGTAAPFFLREGRHLYRVGTWFRQPVLAATLRRLAEAGVEDFYRGAIAAEIHADMVRHDGFIRDDDLAQIPWPIEREPLETRFNGDRVLTFGPPGAGRVLIEMLNVLDQFGPEERNLDTPTGALLLALVTRRAQQDRHDRPFMPEFYWQVSGSRMINRDYAQGLAEAFRRELASAHGETTHLSVMDRFGNVVGLTQSIERVYGSYAASPELGFLYNNYMSAYEHHDINHPYYLRPNAPPWASVAPTLVFRDGRPWAVLGSPGSERIVSTVVQVLLRLEREAPFEAVDAPRLHCSVDGLVSLEGARMRDDIPRLLERHGFEVRVRDPYSFYLGCVALVLQAEGEFIGVADPRRDGSAGGPQHG